MDQQENTMATGRWRKALEDTDHFTMHIHYGGKFLNRPTRYEGGQVEICERCEPDKMSMLIFRDISEQLGYEGMIKHYYLMAEKTYHSGLRLLVNDSDVVAMVAQLPPSRIVHIYIEGNVKLIPSQASCGPDVEVIPSQASCGGPNVVVTGGESSNGGPCDKFDQTGEGGLCDKQLREPVGATMPGEDSALNGEIEGQEQTDDEGNNSDSDEGFFVDSDYEQSEDDLLYDANIDKDAEWGGIREQQPLNLDLQLDSDDGVDYGDDSNDDLHSVYSNSDDDGKTDKHAEFRIETDLGKVQFKVGMKFANAIEFRTAVREYAIKEGKDIKFIKNETTRVRVVCNTKHMDGDDVTCKWSIGASLTQKGESFQVNSYKDTHDCLRTFNIRAVTSNYLSHKYVDSIRSNPKMPVEAIVDAVRKDLVVEISPQQAYRAKRKALDLIEGTNMQQFGRLRDYCEEVRRTNPNTTIVIKTTPSPTLDGQPTFERLYVCLGALKEGMLSGCRRLICMDACHLKGAHGGVMLVAVGIDGNNQSFPFAYAVAESETKDSWVWFLQLVTEDLEIQNSAAWTVITDKQKGLIPALQQVLPNAEMRFCTRHLYTNFRDHHKGMELRKILWEAAKSTTVPDFNRAMEKMKEADVEAYKWLAEKPPMQWSRSHFATFNSCDILVNNLCEGFNKDINKARDKPIVTMLEGVRCFLMKRLTKRREKIKKWEHSICPNIIDKIEKYKKRVGDCNPIWCGDGHFQIYCSNMEQYSLDLGNKTCSCRRWDLKGIPCVHAITAIIFKKVNILEYIHPCYKKETNLNIYKGIIYPINGWNMWPDSGCVPILPPNYGRSAGRPRKNRRKDRTELEEEANSERLKRCNTSLRCGKCGQWGHNIRSCKNEANPDIRKRASGGYVFPKPSGGRPRGRPRGTGTQFTRPRGNMQPRDGTQASPVVGDQGQARGRGGARGRPRGRGGARGRGAGRGTSFNQQVGTPVATSSVAGPPASSNVTSSAPTASASVAASSSAGRYSGMLRRGLGHPT